MTSDTGGADSKAKPMISAGVMLANERVRRGISLQEVADQIKLSRRQIEALEADDYDKLPGMTFVRGFTRNYARFLGIEAEPLLHWIDSRVAAQAPHPLESVPTVPVELEMRTGMLSRLLVTGGVIVVALAAIIYVGMGVMKSESPEHGGVPPVTPTVAMTPPAPIIAVSPTPSVPAVVPPAPAVSVAPVIAPVPPSPTVPVAEKSVRVVVQADSWVSVIDANGRKVVYGLIRAGEERQASGIPPFSVKVGNVSGVTLYVNDVKINWAEHIRAGRSTASLELN